MFQCHVQTIRGHANPTLLEPAAALQLLSLSRLPVRTLPYSRFVFFLQSAPTLKPQETATKNKKKQKNIGRTARTEFRPRYQNGQTAIGIKAPQCSTSYLFHGFPSQSPIPP